MKMSNFDMEHSIDVQTDLQTAFDLINNVDKWPDVFPPCRAARVVERDGDNVVIEITAEVGGSVRTWRSQRRVQRDEWRVDFHQADPFPPIASMTGYWQVRPGSNGSCSVVLFHGFQVTEASAAAGDPPRTVEEAEQWLREACDRNSKSELSALKKACEDTS